MRVRLAHSRREGAWFAIEFDRVYLSLELVLGGVDSDASAMKTNTKAPWRSTAAAFADGSLYASDPTKYEVRFARHLEYEDRSASSDWDAALGSVVTPRDCATIDDGIAGMYSLRGTTLAMMQMPKTGPMARDVRRPRRLRRVRAVPEDGATCTRAVRRWRPRPSKAAAATLRGGGGRGARKRRGDDAGVATTRRLPRRSPPPHPPRLLPGGALGRLRR